MYTIQTVLAYCVDCIVGDPQKITHPVIIIGKLISLLESKLRISSDSPTKKLIKGFLLVLIVTFLVYITTYLAIIFLTYINYWIGYLFSIWLISTTIASKSLSKAGKEIYELLCNENLVEARVKVGWIVGRDTQNLKKKEIIRATIETVAENIVDGIVAPIFYAWLGGAPLAMTYRAINTMDSMLGYKNEKYIFFGRVAARLDDVANFIPARITGLLIIILSFILSGYYGTNSFKALVKDAKRHPSPNSGWPEASVAGALNIKLGGLNYYNSVPSYRAEMGPGLREFETIDIKKTIKLMYGTGVFLNIIFLFIHYLF